MKLPFIIPKLFKDDPVPAFHFVVMFNTHTISFGGVSGISKVQDVRYFNEGGRNDYPLIMKEPQHSPHLLTFTRGLHVRRASSALLSFVPDIFSGLLDAQNALENPYSLGTIIVLDRDNEIKAIYSFISQGQVEWKLGDLDALTGQRLIEKCTIAHRGLVNIPVPTLF